MQQLKKYWTIFWRPSSRYALGGLLLVGFIVGILFWGGFHWALELTNTEQFCISCHEMQSTVYQELKKTIHYSNRSGVRATCPDCHVPRPWLYKVIRKIKASNELFHHFRGTINTKEKFEAHRRELAKHVWAAMEATDSRECRNCHHGEFMKPEKQSQRAQKRHQEGIENQQTCIDCHKGIAHKDVHKEMEKEKEAAKGANFDLDF